MEKCLLEERKAWISKSISCVIVLCLSMCIVWMYARARVWCVCVCIDFAGAVTCLKLCPYNIVLDFSSCTSSEWLINRLFCWITHSSSRRLQVRVFRIKDLNRRRWRRASIVVAIFNRRLRDKHLFRARVLGRESERGGKKSGSGDRKARVVGECGGERGYDSLASAPFNTRPRLVRAWNSHRLHPHPFHFPFYLILQRALRFYNVS